MSQAARGEQEAPDTVDKPLTEAVSSTFQGSNASADCVLEVYVNGVPASCLVDTGAVSTILSRKVWSKLGMKQKQLAPLNLKCNLVDAQGSPLKLDGLAEVELQLGSQRFTVGVLVAETLTTDLILGRDFLKQHECSVELGEEDLLRLNQEGVTLPLGSSKQWPPVASVSVVANETLCIPPLSEMEIMARVPAVAKAQTWLVEPCLSEDRTAVVVARAMVTPEDEQIPVRILNPRIEPVSLKKGEAIARMEPLHEEVTVAATVQEETGEKEDQPEIIKELVAQASSQLTTGEQEQLFATLLDFADIFSRGPDDLGWTAKIKHKIDTSDAAPIRQQVRRIPPMRRQEASTLLKEMLQKEVIQRSASPWASPIVLVRKKDGSTRFCVDYRKVNNVTRKDAYPLPRVDDTLDTLAGAKWFSTLDLTSGYWQVEVEPKDREKTAFCTPDGLFEFKVMPFGLCNAPATFQQLMDLVLAGLQWSSCLVYLDDIIIVGRTFEEHLQNLQAVLIRLREAGLKLKPQKCALCLPQVEFLGHVVSAQGVSTDPRKTEKVRNWPIPTNRREVQQFLGLASYYRRFVQDFAKIAKPLHRLTEKTSKFEWTSECQAAFNDLRQKLVSAPILAFPDYTRSFVLDTDASDTGMGAVLSQLDDNGAEQVVAYASCTLSRAERRYCVTRKELLAVVTFIKHFRPYLLGKHFTLRTDHGSLTWLARFKEPEGQLARWLEKLQEYDFDILHRPGKRHQNADALSRLPCSQCGRESHSSTDVHDMEFPDEVAGAISQPQTTQLRDRSSTELRETQLQDTSIGFVLGAKEKDSKPTPQQVKGKSITVRKLCQLWDRLKCQDGQLWRRYDDGTGKKEWLQLVVPTSLREEILHKVHQGVVSGHLGEQKMLHQIKERFYWPGMAEDVHNWCQTCASCATNKSPSTKARAPLQTITTGHPMQVVAVDITGPFPESEAGNRYILVVGDYFTRWMECFAIPDQEAETVVRKLVDEVFCRFSPPEQLHSDQGRQFESDLMRQICSILKIEKSRTTAYHPQCDGLVERFNRTLKHMLATSLKDHPFDWEDRLRKVCMAYNSSVHASTGYTPFYLMFGREARLPIDIAYGTKLPVQVSTGDYATQMKNSLEDAYANVRMNLDASHRTQSELYNKKIHGKPYAIGDLVWLHNPAVPPGESRKLYHPWTGPFRVQEKMSDADYRIKEVYSKKPAQVVHFNRLKLCPPGTRLLQSQLQDEDTDVAQEPKSRHTFQMELVDDDSPAVRRSTRDRRPPDFLLPQVFH